jgi:hypothetical protein
MGAVGGLVDLLRRDSARAGRLELAQFALLAGLCNGDPSGAWFNGLPVVLDPAGLKFRIRDPPLLLGEVQIKNGRSGAISFGFSFLASRLPCRSPLAMFPPTIDRFQ